jgi:hypothetical protein
MGIGTGIQTAVSTPLPMDATIRSTWQLGFPHREPAREAHRRNSFLCLDSDVPLADAGRVPLLQTLWRTSRQTWHC